MKKILLFIILLGLFFPAYTFAQSLEEKYTAKQKEIEDLEKKLADINTQQKTLSSQISYMDNQIKLTGLKIAQTEEQISSLSLKIGRLDVSLDQLAIIVRERITASYQVAKTNSLELFFSSKSFSNFMERYKYLRIIQANDKKILYSMEETRSNYNDQKLQVEALKTKLEEQNQILARQKKDKEYLLTTTKNDEKKFQAMLTSAKAEQAAILKILSGGGEVAKIGPVNTGDTVGVYIAGPSACSSGTHLHFEVAKDGSPQDPAGYLRNISLKFEDNVVSFTPRGSWDWPIFEPIRVTQEFGSTFWSRLGWYNGGPHTGYDLVSGIDSAHVGSRTVKTVQKGTLFRGSIRCGGGDLKYSRVDHEDGVQTFYLHLE